MKISPAVLLFLVPVFAAAKGEPLLDALPQNAIQSAFQILRRDYIRREDLSFEELNRAALQGLLERLEFGAEIVGRNGQEKAAEPAVLAEFLAPGIAYMRPESFGEGEGAIFGEALAGLVERKACHLVLDLRAGRVGQFEEAALMLQCFIPEGELMFKMKQLNSEDAELFISKRAPLWSGEVVVLLDEETGNAAEAIAASLRARGRAFIIGEKTRGATVRYTHVQLDERASLRYASAEMLLPDGTSLFKKGIPPHFVVATDLREKHQAYAGSRRDGHVAYVRDRVRPRFNEAALVNGQNPELDDYVRRSKGQPLPGDDGQVRDIVTQRALDVLRARDLMTGGSINWGAKSNEPPGAAAESIPRALPATPAKP